MLLTEPTHIEIRVGDEIDIHMMTETPNSSGVAAPLYPLPSSSDDAVLRTIARTDNGATGSYFAAAIGDVILATRGLCTDPMAGRQTTGPCPVLDVAITR